MGYAIVVSAR